VSLSSHRTLPLVRCRMLRLPTMNTGVMVTAGAIIAPAV
jgi:hypothetical protein